MTTPKLERAATTTDNKPSAWEHGSVVSYPDRCRLWGDGRFRGNCDGRLFLNLVRLYRPRSVADPMLGSGTTRDVIDWLNRTSPDSPPIAFWGSDLHAGFDVEHDDLPGQFDLVWLHPPYWNIIRYSDDPRDLSAEPDYSTFVRRLERSLARCAAALTPGGRLAVLVGDVRRQGLYYPIIRDVLNMEPRLGQLRSILIKVQHHCTSDVRRYRLEDAPIRHENCLVFKNVRRPLTTTTEREKSDRGGSRI